MKKGSEALILFCLISAFFFSFSVVFAQTPDGETPAVETVCSGQSGAAFGLCNAYCEAMDCDSEEPQASEKACNRVFSKFEQLTGEVVPCDMFCGNGIIELDEECDDGINDGTSCNADCTIPVPVLF